LISDKTSATWNRRQVDAMPFEHVDDDPPAAIAFHRDSLEPSVSPHEQSTKSFLQQSLRYSVAAVVAYAGVENDFRFVSQKNLAKFEF